MKYVLGSPVQEALAEVMFRGDSTTIVTLMSSARIRMMKTGCIGVEKMRMKLN